MGILLDIRSFVVPKWLCCCLHLSSTCSHVVASEELQMRVGFDGQVSLPSKSCSHAWPMYCPIWNSIRQVFCFICNKIILHNLFDRFLSISLFSSHVCSWCVWFVVVDRLCLLSCLMMCYFQMFDRAICQESLALSATNVFEDNMMYGVHACLKGTSYNPQLKVTMCFLKLRWVEINHFHFLQVIHKRNIVVSKHLN